MKDDDEDDDEVINSEYNFMTHNYLQKMK